MSDRHNKKNQYVPHSQELRSVIDQFVQELKNSTEAGTSISTPGAVTSLNIDIHELKDHIMKTKPTWKVPETRRLKKFMKRATTDNAHTPSTPSSQSTGTENDELDNKSERSIGRSLRLKGITSRLFGNGSGSNSKRNTKTFSPTTDPPVFEIQTSIDTSNSLKSEPPISNSDVPTDLAPIKNETCNSTMFADASLTHELDWEAQHSSDHDINKSIGNGITPTVSGNDKEIRSLYEDDNDGKISKRDQCCWFFGC